jgi:glycosyltransferase 2 family protein
MKFKTALEQAGATAAATAQGTPRSRKAQLRFHLLLWTKVLLTVGVLALLVFTIHPREILRAVAGANMSLVLSSLIMVAPSLTLRAMKWGYLLRRVKPEVRIREVWATLLIGFTFGVVTPGQVGEFGRAFFISGRPRLELIGLSFIDKLYNLLAIVLFGSVALLFLPGLVWGGNEYIFASCCVLVILLWAGLILMLLSPRWIRDLFYAINVMLPYRDKVKVLLSGLDPIHQRQSIVLSILGIAHYLVSILQFYLLVLSFQPALFWDSFRAAAATIFVKAALPISIGGLGVGETASVAFFRIFGVDKAAAFNSSVMLFSMNVLLPAVIGFLVLLRLRIVPEETHA